MLSRNWTLVGCLIVTPFIVPAESRADLVIDYDVNIVESGSVASGSTINWEVFAVVTGTPIQGSNFGIASATLNLGDSTGETLNAGTIAAPFADYFFTFPGLYNATTMQLENVAASNDFPGYDAGIVEGAGTNPPSVLLATGSYTVTTLGTHTLSALDSGAASRYFFMDSGAGIAYDDATFGSDSIVVTAAAVPEPTSLALWGVAAFGGLLLRRRQRKLGRAR